jgi:hypothetical protein
MSLAMSDKKKRQQSKSVFVVTRIEKPVIEPAAEFDGYSPVNIRALMLDDSSSSSVDDDFSPARNMLY